MKKLFPLIPALLFFFSFGLAQGNKDSATTNEGQVPKVVVAYITSWSDVIPEDPHQFTHINYAFGHVNDSFSGVRIDNPLRLRSLTALKGKNPELKVLLSVGGWGSGRFSEMAASDSLRKEFALSCKEVTDEFGLDGIDIDWEYPTIDWAGISASPDDTKNFSKLMKELRDALGNEKMLTIATSATAKYIDFPSIMPYIDLVNVMTYDMSAGEKHHSALYPSSITPGFTVSEAIEAHMEAGVPANKLVMGIPFFGRGIDNGITYYREYKDIYLPDGYTMQWDENASAPFIADSLGNFAIGFDNPESVKLKCDYILQNGLRGAMFWDYNGDDSIRSLTKTIHKSLLQENKY